MSRSSNYVVDGAFIKIASGTSATATQTLSGTNGTYNIEVAVLPESDGTPTLEVYKGSTLLQKYTYPLGDNKTIKTFTISNVALASGDTIKLVGTIQGGALARVDKLTFAQVSTSTTPTTTTTATSTTTSTTTTPTTTTATTVSLEAEGMTRTNYALDRSYIKVSGANSGTASTSFKGTSGTYNMQVTVLPERDGQPTLEVYKGSTLLQKYTYPLGDDKTVKSFTISNVALAAGETIKLVGTIGGGALARVDKIVLSPVSTSTTTPTTDTSTTTPTTVTTTPSTGTTTPSTGTTTPSTGTLPSTNTRAVATFESLGLYWKPSSNPGSAGCMVRYRKSGEASWKDGLPMWYDTRNGECRGSLVHLTSGSNYEVQFNLPGQSPSAGLTASTWSDNLPIAKTVYLPSGTSSQPLNITEGGSPSGYVLYTAQPGSQSTIDVADAQNYNISISAPYVIIRGLTLKGARQDAIRLNEGAHSVVIEDNDISGWGRYASTNSAGWKIGVDGDSAVRAYCSTRTLERVVIQRNRMHDPRYGANSWSFGHPSGPQAVKFSHCGGNHVIRHNEIYSSDQRYFNDAIGGEDNFSDIGFPNADSDIYGNRIQHVWDDAIEAEGANRNVRIWGNYMDQTSLGVATTSTHQGPVYIFRNVYNRSRQLSQSALDSDDRNTFAKSGSSSSYGGGRRYVFHNTLLQAPPPAGSTLTQGAGTGLIGPSSSQYLNNTVSRNNIFHIWKTWWASIDQVGGSGNDFDHDLYNGQVRAYSGAEPNGIVGTPIYQSGHGWSSEAGGQYQLASNSPGYDKGARIANFNDTFAGAAPDIGAHEAGTAAMKFGVSAGSAGTDTAPSTGTTSPSTGTTSPSTGTTSPSTGTTTPTTSTSSTPYTGTPIALPASFEAENFNKGGQGVAYRDLSTGNGGGQYRTGEDVDIIASADSAGGGYVVNNFQTGEWLAYTVTIPTSGQYDIALRASNNLSSSAAAFHVEVNGTNVTGSVPVPMTGGWSTFQWVGKQGVTLPAGTHVLKVVADQQYFNVNSVRVLASGTTTAPTTGTTTPSTGTTSPSTGTTSPTNYSAAISSAAAYACGFENTYCNWSEQYKGKDTGGAPRSSIVAGGREGGYAVRLHTESGDSAVNGSGSWERNDLRISTSAEYCNQGQEEWWAHSVLFPSDYVFPPSGGGIVMDFHHNSSSGQANFELQTMPGIGLRLRGYGGSTINGGQYQAVVPDPYGVVANVKRNVWYDFVYHMKWSSGTDGFMEAWVNGKKVMSYRGPTLYSGISCYLKLANYHSAFGQASSVIHDRVVRGKSAAEVAVTPLEGVQ